MAAKAIFVVICIFLVSSVQAQLHDQCMRYYNGLGGQDGISKQVPTCKQGMRGLRGCCAEVKALVDAGPEGCLCDEAVWDELVEKIEDAGINGLTKERMNMFANFCSIAHAGSAGCRRLQRSRVRSSTGSSTRSRRSTRD